MSRSGPIDCANQQISVPLFRADLRIPFVTRLLQVLLPAFFVLDLVAQDNDANLLADGAKLEVLGEGYSFTEGPAVVVTVTYSSPISRTIASLDTMPLTIRLRIG